MIARELIEGYGMKQELVAQRLGITQAAVSKYRHQVRGEAVDLGTAAEVRQMSRDIASTLVGNTDALDVFRKVWEVCTDIRGLGLRSERCRKVDPSGDDEHCTILFGLHSCAETVTIEPSSIAKYRKIPIQH